MCLKQNLKKLHSLNKQIEVTHIMIGFLKKSICDFLNFSLLVFDDDEDDDENPAPPYMPIQGQRRTASLEKKRKPNKLTKEKQNKASCKQQ